MLTHYLVIRRDLPLGVYSAQLAHAAGESFVLTPRGSSVKEQPLVLTGEGQVGGSSPPPETTIRRSSSVERLASSEEATGETPVSGSTTDNESDACFHWCGACLSFHYPNDMSCRGGQKCIAVVLGARNEAKLRRLERQLVEAGMPHAAIYEPDPPYHGALMAIGLAPTTKAIGGPLVSDFQLVKDLDV